MALDKTEKTELKHKVLKSINRLLQEHKATRSTRAGAFMAKWEVFDNTPMLTQLAASVGLVYLVKKGAFDSPQDYLKQNYEGQMAIREGIENVAKSIGDAVRDSVTPESAPLSKSSESPALFPDITAFQKVEPIQEVKSSEEPMEKFRDISAERHRELQDGINDAIKLGVGQSSVTDKKVESKFKLHHFDSTLMSEVNKSESVTSWSTQLTSGYIVNEDTIKRILTPEEINHSVREGLEFSMLAVNENPQVFTLEVGHDPIFENRVFADSGLDGADVAAAFAITAATGVVWAAQVVGKIPTLGKILTVDRHVSEMVNDKSFSEQLIRFGKDMKEEPNLTDVDIIQSVSDQVFNAAGRVEKLDDWLMFAMNLRQKRTVNPIVKRFDKLFNVEFEKSSAEIGDAAIDTMLEYVAKTDPYMSDPLKGLLMSSRELNDIVYESVSGNEASFKDKPEHKSFHTHIVKKSIPLGDGMKDKLSYKLGVKHDDIVYKSRMLAQIVNNLKGMSGQGGQTPASATKVLSSMAQILKDAKTNQNEDRVEALVALVDEVKIDIKSKRNKTASLSR